MKHSLDTYSKKREKTRVLEGMHCIYYASLAFKRRGNGNGNKEGSKKERDMVKMHFLRFYFIIKSNCLFLFILA